MSKGRALRIEALQKRERAMPRREIQARRGRRRVDGCPRCEDDPQGIPGEVRAFSRIEVPEMVRRVSRRPDGLQATHLGFRSLDRPNPMGGDRGHLPPQSVVRFAESSAGTFHQTLGVDEMRGTLGVYHHFYMGRPLQDQPRGARMVEMDVGEEDPP